MLAAVGYLATRLQYPVVERLLVLAVVPLLVSLLALLLVLLLVLVSAALVVVAVVASPCLRPSSRLALLLRPGLAFGFLSKTTRSLYLVTFGKTPAHLCW